MIDPKTNPACIVGANIQKVLTGTYNQLQEKIEREMKTITLADLLHKTALLELEHRPENLKKVADFL